MEHFRFSSSIGSGPLRFRLETIVFLQTKVRRQKKKKKNSGLKGRTTRKYKLGVYHLRMILHYYPPFFLMGFGKLTPVAKKSILINTHTEMYTVLAKESQALREF